MIKGSKLASGLIGILIFAIALIGCGGGSGSGDSGGNTPAPSIQVLPASFNFGTVTTNNTSAPLEVKINNNGTAALNVSAISLTDPNNFRFDFSGGSSPCTTSTPTIAAGGTCTFGVSFQPTVDGAFSANVQINSNDSASPAFNLALSGTAEPITNLTVRINQVETNCPQVTAYVSVTDQGGFPITGPFPGTFSVSEGGTPINVFNVTFVSQFNAPISIGFAMDYSRSVTDTPDAVSDIENGLVSFIQSLQAGDEAEIVKFDSEVSVVQAFTSDRAALETAIMSPFDLGEYTRLNDAVNRAVIDAGARANNRKAVIVITDGFDDDGTGQRLSDATIDDVINNAITYGVPIFPIGIGSGVNRAVLTRLADETGGQFFESQISDNLNTIYQQLSSILFENQYIITYTGGLAAPNSANLTIQATTNITGQPISGSDTRVITCQ